MVLTAIILSYNEEHNIGDCIRSVSFADEVLVIDDYSTDETVTIATSLGARVVSHALDGNWAQQRQFAIREAQGDWILFIDADERVTLPLRDAIIAAVAEGSPYAYWMRRDNAFHHNKATHGVLRPDAVLRLMPKEGATVEGFVHEKISSPYPERTLSGSLLHYTYDNWDQYFRKFNKYTTAAAHQYVERHKSCYFAKDIILRPMWAFIKMYFIQGGILDGKLGWILSVNHYFYTMTKYVKLYYLQRSNGKL